MEITLLDWPVWKCQPIAFHVVLHLGVSNFQAMFSLEYFRYALWKHLQITRFSVFHEHEEWMDRQRWSLTWFLSIFPPEKTSSCLKNKSKQLRLCIHSIWDRIGTTFVCIWPNSAAFIVITFFADKRQRMHDMCFSSQFLPLTSSSVVVFLCLVKSYHLRSLLSKSWENALPLDRTSKHLCPPC